jgi:hypothetical protein
MGEMAMLDLAREIIGSQPILTAFLAIGLGYQDKTASELPDRICRIVSIMAAPQADQPPL